MFKKWSVSASGTGDPKIVPFFFLFFPSFVFFFYYTCYNYWIPKNKWDTSNRTSWYFEDEVIFTEFYLHSIYTNSTQKQLHSFIKNLQQNYTIAFALIPLRLCVSSCSLFVSQWKQSLKEFLIYSGVCALFVLDFFCMLIFVFSCWACPWQGVHHHRGCWLKNHSGKLFAWINGSQMLIYL